jgi:hypothetical protein
MAVGTAASLAHLARRRNGPCLRAPLGYGSVTAPRSAPVTRRAYLASTPVR